MTSLTCAKPMCRKSFQTTTYQANHSRRYCSRRCGGISRRRPPEMKTLVCKGCGKDFEVPVYAKRTFCTMVKATTMRVCQQLDQRALTRGALRVS